MITVHKVSNLWFHCSSGTII